MKLIFGEKEVVMMLYAVAELNKSLFLLGHLGVCYVSGELVRIMFEQENWNQDCLAL